MVAFGARSTFLKLAVVVAFQCFVLCIASGHILEPVVSHQVVMGNPDWSSRIPPSSETSSGWRMR
ncbi:hypothetical protein LZ32DRAFT_606693 [Colletotrichum eremochloae]|nr:hypothetical protein LZ32DRAFT_606693 [Colletotrichum eremochloae]